MGAVGQKQEAAATKWEALRSQAAWYRRMSYRIRAGDFQKVSPFWLRWQVFENTVVSSDSKTSSTLMEYALPSAFGPDAAHGDQGFTGPQKSAGNRYLNNYCISAQRF